MRAAMMTDGEVQAAYRAALERKKTGRRNEYRSYSVAQERRAWLEGQELERVSIYSGEYRDPADLGQWLDDRVIDWAHHRGTREAPLMITLAEAAREGTAAAVKALSAARGLPPDVQWTVYRNLQSWRSLDETGRLGADMLAAALLAEWSRLKLPEADPALTEQPGRKERRRWIESEAS